MKQILAEVISNKEIAVRQFRMALAADFNEEVAPGQFAHIRCADKFDPLLRRPMSIYKVQKGIVEVLYKVVGRGTAILSEKKPADKVDIIGPLGNGFNLQKDGEAIVVAGGIGIASFYILAEKLREQKEREVVLILGARSRKDIICEEDFKALGCDIRVCTEDGSYGKKGLVTELLNDILRTTNDEQRTTNDERRTTIYACGPMPMLAAVTKIAEGFGVACQVSLEERMGCGVGACYSCVVKCKDGNSFTYKRVCKYGPVFDAREVVWE